MITVSARYRRFLLLLGASLIALVAPLGMTPSAAASVPTQPAGTVIAATELPAKLQIPDVTGAAHRLTYVTTNSRGDRALSTGAVFIPKGRAPAGGWPVISWAHGTFGLADDCAPSTHGSQIPELEHAYFAEWMRHGYAIVETDYAGLGTAGIPAYLDGTSEAHNVVDMVKAGRQFAAEHLPPSRRISNSWVVAGFSQGGGAAIYTARWATEFGGPSLNYLGAVGTGVPANVEALMSMLRPGVPPVSTGGHLETFAAYILAALRANRPELDLDSALTATGRKYIDLAVTTCVFAMFEEMADVPVGSLLSKPLSALPNWRPTVDAYMKMPLRGFDKPFLMAHGLLDTDVPYATTAAYVAQLVANRQPVVFKSYPGDHFETLPQSQKEQIDFVDHLFRR